MSITEPVSGSNQVRGVSPRGWFYRRGRFLALHGVLVSFSVTALLPFLWMVVTSMKPLDAVEDISPFPTDARKVSYVEARIGEELGEDFRDYSLERKLTVYGDILGEDAIERAFEGMPAQDEGSQVRLDHLAEADQRAVIDKLAMECFSLTGYYAYHAKANYNDVWNSKDISFKRYYFNSLFVAGWVTLLTCFTSSLAAYAFARLQWPGRDMVFKLYLATMMIPGVVTMIPNYTLMVKLHLLDSYTGLVVPAAFSAFGTFLLRQFMLTVSPSLDEAAIIDGASPWQVYWDVILPLARPGLIVLSIFTFMGNYWSFFWPLVLIKSEHLRTLPVGMLYFDTAYGNQTNLIMAASVMNIAPLVILFVLMQKYLVRGIQLGAVKG